MRVFLSSLIFFLSISWCQAQQTAQFEMTLYVEDAIGNKDSVTIGFDTLGTSDIDSEFGEIEILTPFDSIFEVRAGAFDWPERNKLSKKIISWAEPQVGPWINTGCFGGDRIFIYVWAKHQPVKVFWDVALFLNDLCNRASFIADHWTDEVAGPIDLNDFPQHFYCMAVQDSAIFDLSEDTLFSDPFRIPFSLEKEVEGLGVQTVYALRFFPAIEASWSPCYWVTSTKEEELPRRNVHIYPNPGREKINIELSEGQTIEQWQIYNRLGQLVKMEKNGSNIIGVQELPAGIYQVIVQGNDAKNYTGKFIKL